MNVVKRERDRTAANKGHKAWREAKRRGESRTPVSASEVRERLIFWRSHNFYLSLVGHATGLPMSTLNNLVSGKYERCNVDTASAIMNITHTELFAAAKSPISRVPVFAARRRFEALSAEGWSSKRLDTIAMMHKIRPVVRTFSAADSSHVRTTLQVHESMKAIYELAGSPMRAAPQTIGKAEALGWLPREAWEGLDIDDPTAEPRTYLDEMLVSAPASEGGLL